MAAGIRNMTRVSFAELAWNWLQSELDNWSCAGKTAQFWWRDDDAIEVSRELEKLVALSDSTRIPLSLAVIPASLKPGLASYLRGRERISVLQHGYAHVSHAATGARKIELGGSRDLDEIVAELEQGFGILTNHFGDSFQTALTPPWNRIDERLPTRLPGIGIVGISTARARRKASPVAGLLQVNTHLDPINWRHAGGFIGVYPAIAILVQHLVSKRFGYRDASEPTGILTHHLVQNDATWRFVADLLHFLSRHPAAVFVGASDIWG